MCEQQTLRGATPSSPFVLTACIVALFMAPGLPAGSTHRIRKRVVPLKHEKAFRFLELLRWPKAPSDAFDPTHAPKWDVKKLISYIPADGVTFSDVNGYMVGHVPKGQIRAQLEKREGRVFANFSHLSHIYSIPYKQYSELHFEDTRNGVTIDVGGWYQITFRYVAGKPYLSKWHYGQFEGD